MERILIQALPREGLSVRPRAKRNWPSDAPVAVEVVDDKESPTIEVVQTSPHTGISETVRRPDPQRINRTDYEAIKADPVLRILSDGETTSKLSDAAMGAARKQASDLAGELTEVKAKLADAEEQLGKARVRVTGLEAQLAKAQARITELEAKPSDAADNHPEKKAPHARK